MGYKPKLGGIAVVGLCCVGSPAAAQDSAASEALFKKGVEAMEAGDYGSACPAIAESNQLDPRPGTVFALAECEAKWGRIASAVAHYSDYLGLVSHMTGADHARHRARAKTATAQLDALRSRVPLLTIDLPAKAPNKVSITRDGVAVKGPSLGAPLPVDPGEHVIVTQAPGYSENIQKITIEAGQTKLLRIQLGKPFSDRSAPAPPASPSTPSYTWAYVTAGIGVAGVAVGTVTGLMSMSKKATVDDNCNGPACNPDGKSAADSGKTLGNISTVAVGVGIVGLATGIVLWLSAPKAPATQSARRTWQPTLGGKEGSANFVGVEGTW